MEINSLLLTKFSITPWAVHPGMLDIFTNVLNNKLVGEIIKPETVEDTKAKVKYEIYDNTAVIPMHGVILKKNNGRIV